MTCYYCKATIKASEPMVVGKTWRKHGEKTMWSWYTRWHPQCWIDQGLASLEKRPYIPPAGRTPCNIPDDMRKKRVSILRRRASVMQRLKGEMSKPYEEISLEAIIHFGEMLEKQAIEIEPLGGVPKSWI